MSRVLARLALLCLLGTAAVALEGDLNRVYELAAGQAKQKEAAVKLAIAIAEDAARPEAERVRARRLVPRLLLNLGQIPAARQAAMELAKAGDARAVGMAAVLEARIQITEGKPEGATAILRQQLESGEAAVKAEAGYHLAKLLAIEEKGKKTKPETYAEVIALAEAASTALEEIRDVEQALLCVQRAAEQCKDTAAYERVQRRFLSPPLLGVLRPNQREDHAGRLGQVLEDSKRFPEARALYEEQLRLPDATLPRWRFALAQSWKNAGDLAQAVARCEDVFMADSDPASFSHDAQRLIIHSLAADPPRQASAVLTWLEASDNNAEAARMLGGIMGGKDAKQVKAITDWYTFGSAGPDKRVGTADDLSNPRTGVQRAVYPKRLAQARLVLPTSGLLVRRRAILLQWAGRPDEAAALARWWLGQANSAAEMGTATDILASCAAALTGDLGQRSQELTFLAFGPHGPDGKAGTADDLKEPLPATPAFLVPQPTRDDAALLRRLRAVATEIAGDDRVQGGYRSAAFWTMRRIDMLFGQRLRYEEVLPFLKGLPGEAHHVLCATRVAQDGNCTGLPEVFKHIDAVGGDKQPDGVKGPRKAWEAFHTALQGGTAYKAHWQ